MDVASELPSDGHNDLESASEVMPELDGEIDESDGSDLGEDEMGIENNLSKRDITASSFNNCDH